MRLERLELARLEAGGIAHGSNSEVPATCAIALLLLLLLLLCLVQEPAKPSDLCDRGILVRDVAGVGRLGRLSEET